jgi:hypothetical protein
MRLAVIYLKAEIVKITKLLTFGDFKTTLFELALDQADHCVLALFVQRFKKKGHRSVIITARTDAA